MEKATHIIKDTAGSFWAVWDTNDVNLAHVYYGILVKKSGLGFVPKGKGRMTLVRKEMTAKIATIR